MAHVQGWSALATACGEIPVSLPSIMSPDGRRAWAFAAICGGCAIFTVFAAVGVWLVSANVLYTFFLALAAHAQILVGMTALGWTLGRRLSAEASKDGIKINDRTTETTVEHSEEPVS